MPARIFALGRRNRALDRLRRLPDRGARRGAGRRGRMTAIRAATAADALAIAAVHVASWDETYHGLLSEAVIAENTEERRRALHPRRSARRACGRRRTIRVRLERSAERADRHASVDGSTSERRAPAGLQVDAVDDDRGDGRIAVGVREHRFALRGIVLRVVQLVGIAARVEVGASLHAVRAVRRDVHLDAPAGFERLDGGHPAPPRAAASAVSIARASSRRNDDASITMPRLWCEPRSVSFVTDAGLMSTQTVLHVAGSRLPTAIEWSSVQTISAIPISGT